MVLVNTCGFLDSAKEESLDAIGEAIAENGRVIVTGCMGKEAEAIRARFPGRCSRSPARISTSRSSRRFTRRRRRRAHPISTSSGQRPARAGWRRRRRYRTQADAAPLQLSEDIGRLQSSLLVLHHSVSLRGDLASRRPDAILREAEKLVAAGTKELLVISQDTSAYGLDLRHAAYPLKSVAARFKAHMTDLARELGRIAPWVRLHYVYPYPACRRR